MWKDRVRERYWWREINNQIDELLFELAKAEDEEEIDLYLLNLHQKNEGDFQCFTKQEKELVQRLLAFLIQDTIQHRKLLTKIIKEVENIRNHHDPGSI